MPPAQGGVGRHPRNFSEREDTVRAYGSSCSEEKSYKTNPYYYTPLACSNSNGGFSAFHVTYTLRDGTRKTVQQCRYLELKLHQQKCQLWRKRLIRQIFEKFNCKDVLDDVIRYIFPPELYVMWTMEGIRNGTHDSPFRGIHHTRPQATNIHDCLIVEPPQVPIRSIIDEFVCCAQTAEDEGLKMPNPAPDPFGIFGRTNTAAKLWRNGLHLLPTSSGNVRIVHDDLDRDPADIDLDDVDHTVRKQRSFEEGKPFARIMVFSRSQFDLRDFQELELVDDRLTKMATHQILAFREINIEMTKQELLDSYFVFVKPVRLRYDDETEDQWHVTQQSRFFGGFEDTWNLVVDQVFTAQVVTLNDEQDTASKGFAFTPV